jgi:hypothetical protein
MLYKVFQIHFESIFLDLILYNYQLQEYHQTSHIILSVDK